MSIIVIFILEFLIEIFQTYFWLIFHIFSHCYLSRKGWFPAYQSIFYTYLSIHLSIPEGEVLTVKAVDICVTFGDWQSIASKNIYCWQTMQRALRASPARRWAFFPSNTYIYILRSLSHFPRHATVNILNKLPWRVDRWVSLRCECKSTFVERLRFLRQRIYSLSVDMCALVCCITCRCTNTKDLFEVGVFGIGVSRWTNKVIFLANTVHYAIVECTYWFYQSWNFPLRKTIVSILENTLRR